jgi:hypothetical protein
MAKSSRLGEWPRASVFALTPNSASCERVFAFALLRVMYDDTQKRARLQIKCRPR